MGLIFLGLDMDHGDHVDDQNLQHHHVGTCFVEKQYHHGARVFTAFPDDAIVPYEGGSVMPSGQAGIYHGYIECISKIS